MLAAGAALNWALFDHMVRCGVALPAVFYVGFVIGSRCVQWSAAVSAVALLAVNLVGQAYADPRLGGLSILVDVVPITVGFTVAGRLLQARGAAVARLRVRTAERRDQREDNARLAVAADQARIAGDLEGFLHDRVGRIAVAAAAGRARLASEPDRAEAVVCRYPGHRSGDAHAHAIKTHVARILMKLDLRDRVQAVVFAYECGFVVPDSG